MISSVSSSIVESNISNQQVAFTIKSSVEAFRILSSLYSDEISAILRELGTNAVDSHVEAGKPDTPFKVHLPNELEPFFYIQDFGTGLDKEEIEQVYFSYFDSTKRQTNEAVGMFGLGSKSVFTYVDNYTIESNKNGIKYIYSAFISEEGFPKGILVVEEKTSDENGVKLQFSVKQNDFRNFRDKAGEVYKFFNILPEGIEIKKFSEERDIIFENDKFLFCKSYSYTSEFYVIQGNICYPLRKNEFPKENESFFSNMKRINLYFKVPIGSVEFTPSREDLIYNKKTVETIKQEVSSFKEDFLKFIENSLENKTSQEKFLFLDSLNFERTLSNAFDIKKVLTEEENKLYNGETTITCDKKTNLVLTRLIWKYRVETYRTIGKTVKLNTFKRVFSDTNSEEKGFTISWETKKTFVVVVKDESYRYSLKVEYLLKKLNKEKALVIESEQHYNTFIKPYLEKLCNPEVYFISKLEIPKEELKTRSVSSVRSEKKNYIFIPYKKDCSSIRFTSKEVLQIKKPIVFLKYTSERSSVNKLIHSGEFIPLLKNYAFVFCNDSSEEKTKRYQKIFESKKSSILLYKEFFQEVIKNVSEDEKEKIKNYTYLEDEFSPYSSNGRIVILLLRTLQKPEFKKEKEIMEKDLKNYDISEVKKTLSTVDLIFYQSRVFALEKEEREEKEKSTFKYFGLTLKLDSFLTDKFIEEAIYYLINRNYNEV